MKFIEKGVYEKKEYEIMRQRIVPFTKLDDTEIIW